MIDVNNSHLEKRPWAIDRFYTEDTGTIFPPLSIKIIINYLKSWITPAAKRTWIQTTDKRRFI